jgi:hypothetical protein
MTRVLFNYNAQVRRSNIDTGKDAVELRRQAGWRDVAYVLDVYSAVLLAVWSML